MAVPAIIVTKEYEETDDPTQQILDGRETIASLNASKSQNDKGGITRKLFYEVVKFKVNRDEALTTLIPTFRFAVVYYFVIMFHVANHNNTKFQDPLKDWANGRDPYNDAENNIDDMDSFWDWLMNDKNSVGLINFMGVDTDQSHYVKMDPQKPDINNYQAANRHYLIGDVRMEKTQGGTTTTIWLLNEADAAKSHLNANTGKYYEAAIKGIEDMKTKGWSDYDVEKLRVEYFTYNEAASMFGQTVVQVEFETPGTMELKIASAGVSTKPYDFTNLDPFYANGVPVLLLDIIYFILLMNMTIPEASDALKALRAGCDEFKDYLAFWNVVDWFSIFTGLSSFLLWVVAVIMMYTGSQLDILDGDLLIKKDLMLLSLSDLNKVYDAINGLGFVLKAMKYIMVVNTVSIVLKFFKSFNANARLQLVTKTISHARTDLAHFGIVLLALWVAFANIGQLMFGHDCEELHNIWAAVVTTFQMLFGEIAWYYEQTQAVHEREQLASGQSAWFIIIWFILYMLLFPVVLFNVLLAIVVDSYISVTQSPPEENPTILKQFEIYRQQVKLFKEHGFLDLEDMLFDIENDDNETKYFNEDPDKPPDPQIFQKVTKEFLQEQWPKMPDEQVNWLIVDESDKKCLINKWRFLFDGKSADETATLNYLKLTKSLGPHIQSNGDAMDEINALLNSGDDAKYSSVDSVHEINEKLIEVMKAMNQVHKDQGRLSNDLQAVKEEVASLRIKRYDGRGVPPVATASSTELEKQRTPTAKAKPTVKPKTKLPQSDL